MSEPKCINKLTTFFTFRTMPTKEKFSTFKDVTTMYTSFISESKKTYAAI